MKTVFVGGGSHRLVSIIRGALAQGSFDGGEIALYDLNVTRAEAVGRTLRQCPEFRRAGARISWDKPLDEALEGADAATLTMPALPAVNARWTAAICENMGFPSSDNVSPSGSFFALLTAPVLLDLAARMEKRCPDAWLLDFANPVAVLSGMVNRHTRIRSLGLCAGFTNHLADISRILGKDETRSDIDVDAAGINHLSFIVDGTVGGRNIFEAIDGALAGGWTMPPLDPRWGSGAGIRRSVTQLVRFYRELGVLIFSTEGDGMMHLAYDEAKAENQERLRAHPNPNRAGIAEEIRQAGARQTEKNREFEARSREELNDAFWAAQDEFSLYGVPCDSIFLRILRGVAGVERVKIVSSHLNRGAIAGLPDDATVEYSQYLYKKALRPAGRYELPGVVHGLISGLAVHQTLMGDACATGDPRLLAQALLSYPMEPYSASAKAVSRAMIEANRDVIAPSFAKAVDYLR